ARGGKGAGGPCRTAGGDGCPGGGDGGDGGGRVQHAAGAAARHGGAGGGAAGRGLGGFGGAGGLHACALADSLGCAVVLFPRHAGLLSAIGALNGGSRRERSRSVLIEASEETSLGRALDELEAAMLAEFSPSERARVRLERWAEGRYRGQ